MADTGMAVALEGEGVEQEEEVNKKQLINGFFAQEGAEEEEEDWASLV